MQKRLAMLDRRVVEGELRLARQLALIERYDQLGDMKLAAGARGFLAEMERYQRLMEAARNTLIRGPRRTIAAEPAAFQMTPQTVISYAAEALAALDVARLAMKSLRIDIGENEAALAAADIAIEWLDLAHRALNLEESGPSPSLSGVPE